MDIKIALINPCLTTLPTLPYLTNSLTTQNAHMALHMHVVLLVS